MSAKFTQGENVDRWYMDTDGMYESADGPYVSYSDYAEVKASLDLLLLSVASIYPGETRFATALRYIRERESQSEASDAQSTKAAIQLATE